MLRTRQFSHYEEEAESDKRFQSDHNPVRHQVRQTDTPHSVPPVRADREDSGLETTQSMPLPGHSRHS